MESIADQEIILCGNCLSHHYHYDNVYSPYCYSEEIRYLITKLKYHSKVHYAQVLAKLFILQTPHISNFQLPEAIIPMPMHKKRLQERGFNQALELSRFFKSYYQLPMDYTRLYRNRNTSLQAGLQAKQRQKNVQHAFTIKKTLPYQHIALIDDVMTTGSTVNAAAYVLKKSGVKQIDIWTIARAGLSV